MQTNDSVDIRNYHIEAIFINVWILEGVCKMLTLHFKSSTIIVKTICIVFPYKCNREQKQFILYLSDSKFNLLSKYAIRFTVSNIPYNLWHIKEP